MAARVAFGGRAERSMRVIVPLLLSLAMWAFILLGLVIWSYMRTRPATA